MYISSGISEAVVQRCSVKKGVLRNFAKFTETLFDFDNYSDLIVQGEFVQN